jgi:hypothetical protein
VERVVTGEFIVAFDRNVRDCAYVATIGLPGFEFTEERGFITTVAALPSANAVYVTTNATSGAAANRSFHLQVICPVASASASAQALQANRPGSSTPLRKKPILRSNSLVRNGR